MNYHITKPPKAKQGSVKVLNFPTLEPQTFYETAEVSMDYESHQG